MPAAPVPAQGAISALVKAQADEQRPEGSPIALQFERVPPPRPTGYARQPVAPEPGFRDRIRVRPVVPGRSGAWVRTGVSWRDLAYDVWNPRVRAHRDALRELYASYTVRATGYASYGEQAVFLDEFGSSLWPLLARAVEAGVESVPAKASSGPVLLATEPATVALDLTRSERAKAATLAAHLSVGEVRWLAAAARLIGRPLHGVVIDRSGCGEPGLLIAPVEPAPTDAIGQLVAAGEPVRIPADDVDRFLRVYYPRLRRAVPVTSSDGSVSLPEIRPPRLGLTVRHLPGHETALDWSYRYPAGESVTAVPLADTGALPGLRDPRAEQDLQAGVDLIEDSLPQLSSVVGGRQRLVPSVRLRALDAAHFSLEVLPRLSARDDIDIEIVGSASDYRHSDSAPLVHLSATETPGSPDWFDLEVTVTVDEEQIPFQALFAALALGESHLILDSGTFFSIERPEYDELRRLIEEARSLQDRASDALRVSTYQAGLWSDLMRLGIVEAQSESWATTVKGLLNLDEIARPPVPPGLKAQLRDYQSEGYHWLSFLRDHGLGGILADDMGLGKTL